ncbi:hypothetical protein C0992_012759 [Termitomyces sp. T32_za158]|nr:hypothetical protein C0992_012759 [Termitomyces sp. T32_za158]
MGDSNLKSPLLLFPFLSPIFTPVDPHHDQATLEYFGLLAKALYSLLIAFQIPPTSGFLALLRAPGSAVPDSLLLPSHLSILTLVFQIDMLLLHRRTLPLPTNIKMVDPIKTYLQLLAPDDECIILTVAQDSQAIKSIMLTVDNKSEVEAIVDSRSQIISMSADITNKLGIIYDPTIHLNMQSANGTVDKSLGLAKNVECTIGDLTFYLQIHILHSPAYDILLS